MSKFDLPENWGKFKPLSEEDKEQLYGQSKALVQYEMKELVNRVDDLCLVMEIALNATGNDILNQAIANILTMYIRPDLEKIHKGLEDL